MTGADLVALLPLIVLVTAAVAAMLAIAVRRRHDLAFGCAAAGLGLTLAAVWPAWAVAPRAVTELLAVDLYALAYTALAALAGLAVVLICRGYFESRDEPPEELYLLILTALAGAAVLAAARHFAAFFLGLEILSVSLFALIAYPCREPRALEAGIKYLVLAGLSSAFLLFGMALVYAEAGSLAFAGLARTPVTPVSLVGALLILAGVAFKLSLVPFHLWTADVYEGAPAPITALLATVSKGAVFVLLLRFGLAGGWATVPLPARVLSVLAVATMLAGNLLALRQENLKRLLAYSSIAHMGYLLILPVAARRIGGAFAAEALLFYLAAYFLSTLAAFGTVAVLGSAEREAGAPETYAGLFHTRPWPAAVLAGALLSLAGIPLTAGFVAKFYLFAAGGQGDLWWLVAALIVGSGLGLFYYVRVILHMLRPAAVVETAPLRVPLAANLVLAVLLVLLVGLGVYPGAVVDWVEAASR
jgi:NADH-quinone oxidoreductase subunit N